MIKLQKKSFVLENDYDNTLYELYRLTLSFENVCAVVQRFAQ